MKKIFLMLALAGMSVAGMAQTGETPEMKYSVATNSFWSNWFVSADLSYGAFYSNEEDKFDYSKSPLKDFRRNLGLSVAVGKWFTPGIGLRTKINGIWGRNVVSEDAETNAMKYWDAQEQVLFNLSNLFCGYSETRKWNLIPYLGTGILRNCTENEYAHAYSIGLLNNWKLTDKLLLNLDLGFNISDDDLSAAAHTNHNSYATSIGTADRYFNLEVGVTYNLGKGTWKKTPDTDALKELAQSQIDALNAQLADEEAENARLKNMLAEANKRPAEPKTIVEEKLVAAPATVFFNLNSAQIVSRKDLEDVKLLADIAKANGKKLTVTGYADNKTGKENGNVKLSEKRAAAVKAELLKMGVSESAIETIGAGGVDDLTPYPYNRRATVIVK